MLQNFTGDNKKNNISEKKSRVTPRLKLYISLSVLVMGLILFFFLNRNSIFTPHVSQFLPQNPENVELNTEIEINFTRPIDRQSLALSISPDIEGEWSFEKPLFGRHFFRSVRFIPKHTFFPETTYQIKVDNIHSPAPFGKTDTYTKSFATRKLPGVKSVSPQDKEQNISPKKAITIELTEMNTDIAEFEFIFEPKISFDTTWSQSDNYVTLTPKEPLIQSTEYNMTVYRTGVSRDLTSNEIVHRTESKKIHEGSFKTLNPPQISSTTPSGDTVFIDSPISITFTDAINIDSLKNSIAIKPEIDHTISLSDDGLKATITPSKKLAYDTEYDISIPAGTETNSGGYLPEDVSFQFTTIGEIKTSRISPADNTTGVGIKSGIQITFDQEVDHVSTEEHIVLEPNIPLTFRWENNTVNIQPTRVMQYNTKYQLTIQKGAVSVHGLDLTNDLTYSFTTEPEVVKLSIASDLQDQALSCEAAALKMALAGKGVSVSESDIMNYVGFDPTPHSGATWGDPYEAFVGDIKGKQNTTGYGVYWDPIARAANHWRPAEAFTGWTTEQLTNEISKGNAVVVWGIYGSGYEDSWHTPEGKYIYAWKGEHARTVIGYVGSKENPTQIIINDTYAGQIYWSRARFEQDWAIFGNAGVVVR